MKFSLALGASKPRALTPGPPRGSQQTFGYMGPGRPTTLYQRFVSAARMVLGKFTAYSPNIGDRQLRITQDMVTVDRIEASLYQAWLGFMAPLAEIYDLMPASNPILRGIRNQLKAGVKSVGPEITPPANVDASRAKLAETIANDVRGAIDNPDAPFTKLVGEHVECRLRGGGLIEILWERVPAGKPDAGRWHWTGFNLVPQHRVRFDRYTGEIGFAQTAFQFLGEPVSSFPRGTFIAVTPDREVPDFSKRGTYRAILTDWFAMQNVAGWWQGDIEFIGSPIVAASYDNDADRETMNRALSEMGSSGRLAFRKGSDVKLIEKASRTGPKGSAYNEFETTRAQRMSIAFLGATQTVTVDSNTGSQSSSDNMADVRSEVIASHWEEIVADVRRDLLQVYVELNYGLENADLTPLMGVDLEEAADAGLMLDAFTKGDAIGLQVGEDFARKKLKWPKPAPGEKVLTKPAVDPLLADASAIGGGPHSMPPPDGKPADGKQPEKRQAA